MSRVPWRIAYAVGWFRFRGWSNAYWREDTIRAWLCDHDALFCDELGTVSCHHCGTWLGNSLTTTTGTATSVVSGHWWIT